MAFAKPLPAADAPVVLKYGVLASFPPFQVWPEGGQPGGADLQLVRALARELGVTVELVRYADYLKLENDLFEGRIQLASSLARTVPREVSLVFTSPYTQVPLALVTRADQPSGALLPDLAGRSVALVRGFASEEQADRLFPLATRVVVNTVREGLEAVRSGRADTVLESLPVLVDLMARERLQGLTVARRIDTPSGRLHLALPRSQAALAARFDAALQALPKDRIKAWLQEWTLQAPLAPPTHVDLTEQERQDLARWRAPVVGVVGHDPPFVRWHAGNAPGADAMAAPAGTVPQGLAVDMLLAMLQHLGHKPAGWVPLRPEEASQALTSGRVELLIGADESVHGGTQLRFVGPYLEFPTVLVGKPESGAFSLQQLNGRRLALTASSPARPWVDSRYRGIDVVDSADLRACLLKVARGEADATLSDVVSAALALVRLGRPEIQMIGSEVTLRRYHSVALAERDLAIVPIFKRAMDVAIHTQLPDLKLQWLVPPRPAEVARALALRWLPWVLLALALLAGLWALHARRLRAEVRRTQAAQLLAERVGAASRRFTTYLAHEVRNSLHSVVAGTELARNQPLSGQPQGRDLNLLMSEAAHSTLRLLNNLIDRERLDAGRMSLHLKPADLVGALRSVVDEMAPAAALRGLQLQTQLPAQVPQLMLDVLRLQQVLRNLLVNAIKYGKRGVVELELQIEGAGDEVASRTAALSAPNATLRLRLLVHDRGPGVDPALLPRLFESFVSSAGQASSAGMGLALSRDLARLMGGELSLAARPGGGTTAQLCWVAQRAVDPAVGAAAGAAFGSAFGCAVGTLADPDPDPALGKVGAA